MCIEEQDEQRRRDRLRKTAILLTANFFLAELLKEIGESSCLSLLAEALGRSVVSSKRLTPVDSSVNRLLVVVRPGLSLRPLFSSLSLLKQ